MTKLRTGGHIAFDTALMIRTNGGTRSASAVSLSSLRENVASFASRAF